MRSGIGLEPGSARMTSWGRGGPGGQGGPRARPVQRWSSGGPTRPRKLSQNSLLGGGPEVDCDLELALAVGRPYSHSWRQSARVPSDSCQETVVLAGPLRTYFVRLFPHGALLRRRFGRSRNRDEGDVVCAHMPLRVVGPQRRSRSRWSIIAVALAVLLTSSSSEACTWVVLRSMEALGAIPTDGYPVNSRLPIFLSGFASDALRVSGSEDAGPIPLLPPSFFVDSGLPLRASQLWPSDEFTFGEVRIADLGLPGMTVKMHAADARVPNARQELSVIVASPDHTPPEQPRVGFGVHQYALYPSERDLDTCGGDPPSNLTLWVHLSLDAEPTTGAPTVYKITALDPSGLIADETILAHGRETVIPLRGLWRGDPHALRLSVVATDMAGNSASGSSASMGAFRRDWGSYGRVDLTEPIWENEEAAPGGNVPTIAVGVPRPVRLAALPVVGGLVLVLLLRLRSRVATSSRGLGRWAWPLAIACAFLWAAWLTSRRWQLHDETAAWQWLRVGILVLGAAPLLRAIPAAGAALVIAADGRAPVRRDLMALTGLALLGWYCSRMVTDAVSPLVGLEPYSFTTENVVWPEVAWMSAVCVFFAFGMRALSHRAPLDPEFARAPLSIAFAAAGTQILTALNLSFSAAVLRDLFPLWFGALLILAGRSWGRYESLALGLLGAAACWIVR